MVFELMKRIVLAPSEIPHKVNKLPDRMGDATLKFMMESMTQWNLKNGFEGLRNFHCSRGPIG